jgi:uncharacterized membrane protein
VLFTTSPWVALQLVSGATDIPVLGFVLVGLTLASRERFEGAGVAMGIAAGLKALAWPAIAIALILVWVRGRWRALTRFIGTVALVLVYSVGLLLLPVLAGDSAVWRQTLNMADHDLADRPTAAR